MIENILQKVDQDQRLTPPELQQLLDVQDPALLQSVFDCAYRVKEREVGKVVYLRGLIEWSNVCNKDCYYCGIRKSNKKVRHFQMSEEQILQHAVQAYRYGYSSIVLQSGERQSPGFTALVERTLKQIHQLTDGKLRVTLSLGEQTEETYKRWFQAGASRYLLRIETTNPKLYRELHPEDHNLETRKHCLSLLKKNGYQVGTGVMIGLPGQTNKDLLNDLLFMQDIDIDMVGMGPYIPHQDTPMGRAIPPYSAHQNQQALLLGLKMIAVTRIFLRDINIVAATSLHALAADGREQGIRAGANVIMLNLTEAEYRASYSLYDNKPCINEHASSNKEALYQNIEKLGESIRIDDWGDSKHFRLRT